MRQFSEKDIERIPEYGADAPYDEEEGLGMRGFRLSTGEKLIKKTITLHGVETEFLVGENQSVEKLERSLMRSGYANRFLENSDEIQD